MPAKAGIHDQSLSTTVGMSSGDTIFASITGRGGAVTVIRLSGPGAFAITTSLTRLPPPRRATLRTLIHANAVLDHALVTTFPAPNSFTGEDCVELSLHGGRAVLAALAAALVACGARPAEPGEFSRRAFLNGRLDLITAEATADLIAAETEAQRRLALTATDSLPATIAAWRETLRHLIAQQEALIDFPDEDLPPEIEAKLLAAIAALHSEIAAGLAAAPAAARLREGLEFVILGPPNAGKSTLLNALAGAPIAIVSEIPGTTRDAIGVRLDLAGIPVHLTDTAGLRATTDPIETEGIARALTHAGTADLLLVLTPADAPGATPVTPPGVETLHLFTKADLAPPPSGTLAISAVTGAGLAALTARLTDIATRLTDTAGAAALSRPRQVAALQEAAAALASAASNPHPELRAEDLRATATALARLTGTIGIEQILDAVFNSFCIGK